MKKNQGSLQSCLFVKVTFTLDFAIKNWLKDGHLLKHNGQFRFCCFCLLSEDSTNCFCLQLFLLEGTLIRCFKYFRKIYSNILVVQAWKFPKELLDQIWGPFAIYCKIFDQKCCCFSARLLVVARISKWLNVIWENLVKGWESTTKETPTFSSLTLLVNVIKKKQQSIFQGKMHLTAFLRQSDFPPVFSILPQLPQL